MARTYRNYNIRLWTAEEFAKYGAKNITLARYNATLKNDSLSGKITGSKSPWSERKNVAFYRKLVDAAVKLAEE